MSKRPDIVVIAGLSGVGKSYLINKLKADYVNVTNFSAGSLIKKRRSNTARDQLRLYDQDGIMQNQNLLIEQFLEEVTRLGQDKTVLFDAHMLVDTDEGIVDIPLEIFSRIDPSSFIFLSVGPEIILARRTKDISRHRPKRTEEEIRSQQDRSILLATDYAQKLNIPLLIASSNQFVQIKSFLGFS